ncbi:MAG TPA: hypothetical protein ENJ00_03510 [Phycisphaerales bacterium]|nr:hypothetical protein [Phycisphaerales bacterium]
MNTTQTESPLHERMLAAVGERTYRRIGEITGTHPETVRRYLQGQSPSVEFISSMCTALGINGQWMLTGEGAMRVADATTHALQHADPGEILAAIAGTLDRLGERIDRLELFVQQLEIRVRGQNPAGKACDGQEIIDRGGEAISRAGSIGRALAQRPRSDVG